MFHNLAERLIWVVFNGLPWRQKMRRSLFGVERLREIKLRLLDRGPQSAEALRDFFSKEGSDHE